MTQRSIFSGKLDYLTVGKILIPLPLGELVKRVDYCLVQSEIYVKAKKLTNSKTLNLWAVSNCLIAAHKLSPENCDLVLFEIFAERFDKESAKAWNEIGHFFRRSGIITHFEKLHHLDNHDSIVMPSDKDLYIQERKAEYMSLGYYSSEQCERMAEENWQRIVQYQNENLDDKQIQRELRTLGIKKLMDEYAHSFLKAQRVGRPKIQGEERKWRLANAMRAEELIQIDESLPMKQIPEKLVWPSYLEGKDKLSILNRAKRELKTCKPEELKEISEYKESLYPYWKK